MLPGSPKDTVRIPSRSTDASDVSRNTGRGYAEGVQISEAERQRRSRLARELHRRGVLGGKGPAQRSVEARRQKARRASELTQALVVKHAGAIEAALVEALKTGST